MSINIPNGLLPGEIVDVPSMDEHIALRLEF